VETCRRGSRSRAAIRHRSPGPAPAWTARNGTSSAPRNRHVRHVIVRSVHAQPGAARTRTNQFQKSPLPRPKPLEPDRGPHDAGSSSRAPSRSGAIVSAPVLSAFKVVAKPRSIPNPAIEGILRGLDHQPHLILHTTRSRRDMGSKICRTAEVQGRRGPRVFSLTRELLGRGQGLMQFVPACRELSPQFSSTSTQHPSRGDDLQRLRRRPGLTDRTWPQSIRFQQPDSGSWTSPDRRVACRSGSGETRTRRQVAAVA